MEKFPVREYFLDTIKNYIDGLQKNIVQARELFLVLWLKVVTGKRFLVVFIG